MKLKTEMGETTDFTDGTDGQIWNVSMPEMRGANADSQIIRPGFQGNRIKIAVILTGASAWAKVEGRCAVKNPVECLNGFQS